MSATTQTHRSMAVGTALSDDTLLLKTMSGQEGLGQLFEWSLELASHRSDIDPVQLLGTNATVRVETQNGTRYFNGMISEFRIASDEGSFCLYHATVVPWFWLLTRTADCRIFMEKTVPEIIQEVFSAHGLTPPTERLTGNYRTWDYCVQYRETDFNFLSRLMEQEGIYYYFTHDNGSHEMILADAPGAHEPFPNYAKIEWRDPGQPGHDREQISRWQSGQSVKPGGYTLGDFDFKKPNQRLEAVSRQSREHAQSGFEIYDYPGEYASESTSTADGEAYASARLDEMQSRYHVVRGGGDTRGISAGHTFELKKVAGTPRPDQVGEHLVISASFDVRNDPLETHGNRAGGPGFTCQFSAIPADQQYRPPRLTPKPTIPGPQTATVVGRSGEEVDPDEHGRVRVMFHWDRYAQGDQTSSCWVRVSQGWAGNKYGTFFLPRVGQEVIVEFLEGDPDRPIVTGCVYNGKNKPPYDLPGNKTRSTIKTLSSKDGGGYNEIRFEDKKGSEQIYMYTEKDLDVRAKNDMKTFVGRDQHLIVKEMQYQKVEADQNLIVKGDQNAQVGGNASLDVDFDLQEKVGMNWGLETGMGLHLKAGTTAVIEAAMGLTIKCGSSFVTLSSAGVFISGPMVMINSGGTALSGAGASPTAPAEAEEADSDQAGEVTTAEGAGASGPSTSTDSNLVSEYQPPSGGSDAGGPAAKRAAMMRQAAEDGVPFVCADCGRA